jgi:hypothetical protein
MHLKNLFNFILAFLFLAIPVMAIESVPMAEKGTEVSSVKANSLYDQCQLESLIDRDVFEKAMEGYNKIESKKNLLVIVDFSKPSVDKRFFVIDIKKKEILYHTLVAHGRNSGENFASKFSNMPGSLQSSLGFYLTGSIIQSPKHGMALVLRGLEKGINDKAKEREIIIHAADYVSESFCKTQGRLGRSHGCPALPADLNKEIVQEIQNGAVLYIHANDNHYLSNSIFLKN